jgi:hypothetical protein
MHCNKLREEKNSVAEATEELAARQVRAEVDQLSGEEVAERKGASAKRSLSDEVPHKENSPVIHPSMCPSIHTSVNPFTHPPILQFIRSFLRSFADPLIQWCIDSLFHWFIG